MSAVLLGQAYYLRFDPKLYAAMQPYPPLGALYAAAVLRRDGHDVALFDAMLADSEADWDAALERERPRLAVIYEDSFNYLSKMCLARMREAALTMCRMARARGCTVVVAGSDASDDPAAYLDAGASFVIVGEGEVTLAELAGRLAAGGPMPPADIAGLAFRDATAVVRTAPRSVLADLDALPYPAWDLVDIERYRAIWLARHGYFSMNMVTTRGCPYHCNWCAKPIWGQRYHARSPESVVAEMRVLAGTYRPDHLWFCDDILGLKPGWTQRFADALAAEALRIPFKSLHRADLLVRGDTAEALARAGARTVWLGAESGSQRILDAMDKGTTVAEIHEAARRLRAAGVEVCLFLQFGYPGETRADIEATLAMVRAIAPDDIGMSVSYPLPGTRFHRSVEDTLGATQHWQDSADLAMLYRGPFTTAFYRQLHTVLHTEFRARRGARRLVAALGRPLTLRPAHLREAAAVVVRAARLPLERARLARLARVPHDGIGALPHLPPADAATPTGQGE